VTASTGSGGPANAGRQLPVLHPSVIAAVGGGAMAAFGTVLTWFTIEIGGISAPGGSATGLEGRDGRTVLAAAVVALLAAGCIVVGRRVFAAKVALLAAGAVTAIVAIAGIVDATAKDEEVEDEFGIPADRVVAEVGSGLWVVAVAGVALLAAGATVSPPASGSPRR
jgi:hypothetical protein